MTAVKSGCGAGIAIVGGGIGGLSAGLALLRAGFDVDIYEQAAEIRELGAGLLISMNGVRVLRALGLEAQVRDIDIPAEDRQIRLWNTGASKSLYRALYRGSQPHASAASADHAVYMLHRAELQRILAQAVRERKPDAIHLGQRCLDVSQDGEGVVARFANGKQIRAQALIGADGVHSAVRQALFGKSEGRYTGALAWRGLAPMERLSARQRQPLALTWIGPTAHITCYPLRVGQRHYVSFSAQVERSNWALESWSETGTTEEALADFSGWHEQVREMVSQADTLYKWGLFVRDPLPAWTVGRISLLGDACHSMVPYLGQGVVMALEDALVLARCWSRHAGAAPEALANYEAARHARADRAASESAAMQAVFHHPDLGNPATAHAYMERQWSAEAVRKRYDWLFEYDAATVAL